MVLVAVQLQFILQEFQVLVLHPALVLHPLEEVVVANNSYHLHERLTGVPIQATPARLLTMDSVSVGIMVGQSSADGVATKPDNIE